MEAKDYFPRPTEKPGVEPFEPPFANAVKSEKKMKRLIQFCPYCKENYGEKWTEVRNTKDAPDEITHGICSKPECTAKYLGKDPPKSAE